MMKALSKIPNMIAVVSLFCLMVIAFADVVLRSVLNAPIEAATELIRIFVAVVVFSALPLTSWRGEHITVDLADGIFKHLGLERLRDVLVNLACGVALLWPAFKIIALGERSRGYGDQTEYLHIPTYFITWFIAFSVFVTAAALLTKALLLAIGKLQADTV